MKLNIPIHKYEKVLDKNFEIEIPENPVYLFQFHFRRSVKITPVWTTWNVETYNKPEEIYELQFLIVDDKLIQRVNVQISGLNHLLEYNSNTKNLAAEMISLLNEYDEENIRTKEQFEQDYTNTLVYLKP
jgi:hypothetical protein